jgi:hypothetical protein
MRLGGSGVGASDAARGSEPRIGVTRERTRIIGERRERVFMLLITIVAVDSPSVYWGI